MLEKLIGEKSVGPATWNMFQGSIEEKEKSLDQFIEKSIENRKDLGQRISLRNFSLGRIHNMDPKEERII